MHGETIKTLLVCCAKKAQFNKIFIYTQRDGNNQIQVKVMCFFFYFLYNFCLKHFSF